MKGKIAFALGAAVGYVLGTRAGRERYEQIKRGAQHVWNTEPVQRGVTLVKDAVDERTDGLRDFVARVGADVFTGFATPKDRGTATRTARSSAAAADADAGDEGDTDQENAPAKKPAAKTAKASGGSTKRAPKAGS